MIRWCIRRESTQNWSELLSLCHIYHVFFIHLEYLKIIHTYILSFQWWWCEWGPDGGYIWIYPRSESAWPWHLVVIRLWLDLMSKKIKKYLRAVVAYPRTSVCETIGQLAMYIALYFVGFFPGFLYDSFSIISDHRWHMKSTNPYKLITVPMICSDPGAFWAYDTPYSKKHSTLTFLLALSVIPQLLGVDLLYCEVDHHTKEKPHIRSDCWRPHICYAIQKLMGPRL